MDSKDEKELEEIFKAKDSGKFIEFLSKQLREVISEHESGILGRQTRGPKSIATLQVFLAPDDDDEPSRLSEHPYVPQAYAIILNHRADVSYQKDTSAQDAFAHELGHFVGAVLKLPGNELYKALGLKSFVEIEAWDVAAAIKDHVNIKTRAEAIKGYVVHELERLKGETQNSQSA